MRRGHCLATSTAKSFLIDVERQPLGGLHKVMWCNTPANFETGSWKERHERFFDKGRIFFCHCPSCTTSSIMTMYIMTAQFCLSRLVPRTPSMLLKDPNTLLQESTRDYVQGVMEASSLVRFVIYPAGGVKPATLEVLNQQSSYPPRRFLVTSASADKTDVLWCHVLIA